MLLEGVVSPASGFSRVMGDFHAMPHTMRRLAWVQFFSWIALFSMWLYTTPAVTQVHFGATDAQSDLYNEGANWVGVLFGAYNGFAAVAAAVIPMVAARFGLRVTHLINLFLGGLALISFRLIHDPSWLLAAMVGIGFAWASILSVPYALLANSVPAEKMGLYMKALPRSSRSNRQCRRHQGRLINSQCRSRCAWRFARDAQRLGIYGFGAAAHIVAQVARWHDPVRAAGTGQAQVVATLRVHASHACFISSRARPTWSREEDTTNSMNRLNNARPVRSALRARSGRMGEAERARDTTR